MTEDLAKEFVKKLDTGCEATNLHDRFTLENSQLVDILMWLLKLNPYFRCSSSELIKHPIFDKIRVPSMEKTAPYKI